MQLFMEGGGKLFMKGSKIIRKTIITILKKMQKLCLSFIFSDACSCEVSNAALPWKKYKVALFVSRYILKDCCLDLFLEVL